MSIHPKHGKTKGLNPAPTGFIKAQGLIASRKISNPGSSWIYGSNQIIEHLPNPQNNQIIEKTSNYENWPEVLSLPQVSYCVQIVPAGP